MRWFLVGCVALAGCDAASDPAADPEAGVARLRAALPGTETATILMPGTVGASPEHATFYNFTRGVTYGVNETVAGVSRTVADIVARAPSDTDGDTFAVWGPWTDALAPVTYRVHVQADGEGFTYRVEGWAKDQGPDAAVDVLTGRSEPASGRGAWRYDLTAAHALDPVAQPSLGAVALDFQVGATRTIEVTFTDVQGPRAPSPTSTLYRYTEDADGAGTFDYITNADIHDEEPEKDRRELLRVRSRWRADGPGRADVFASQGDLAAGVEVSVVQCWDAAFAQVYSAFSFPQGAVSEGDAAACAFTDAQRPEFAAFDPVDFADEDLIAALPSAKDFDLGLRPVEDPVAEPADYYTLAASVLLGMQAQTTVVLNLLNSVTRLPPTTCDAGGCTWGPWTEWAKQQTSQVVVTRLGGGRYAYALSSKFFGEPADAWRTLIEGGFTEGQGADGAGWFSFDNDALTALDPTHDGRGQVRTEYARLGVGSVLAMRVNEAGAERARYAVSVVNGAGTLDARFAADLDRALPGRTAEEAVEARVRWRATGAGVGNVTATGGNIGRATLVATECWDEHAARTHIDFLTRRVGDDSVPDGDGPGCVFTDWQVPMFQPLGDE